MLKVQYAIREAADQTRAAFLPRFFKTGPGEYGEGDLFLGVTVPRLRKIVAFFTMLSDEDLETLLGSKWHEDRLTALLILGRRYKKGSEKERVRVVKFYLSHLDGVNNWDLVDTSAYGILGEHLVNRPRTPLYAFARSKNLWKRRIAIVTTFAFIRRGECEETFRIADMLMNDPHDLMHKAVGWMLRECGKRCGKEKLVAYLKPRYRAMPRTMLRYTIEKFPEVERKRYLVGTI